MNVSQDFKDALREIRYQLDALTRENVELRKEVAEVRKLATDAEHASVSQRRAVTMQAIAAQDSERMRHLAITSTDPTEAELLRMMEPGDGLTPPSLNMPPEITNALLANFRSSPPPQLVVQPEGPVTTRKTQGQAVYESMARHAEARGKEAAVNAQVQLMRQQQLAEQAQRDTGRRFGLSETEWF